MHYLSPVYFVNQPVHVSGILVAQHQEVYCVYIYIYIYIHTHSIPVYVSGIFVVHHQDIYIYIYIQYTS